MHGQSSSARSRIFPLLLVILSLAVLLVILVLLHLSSHRHPAPRSSSAIGQPSEKTVPSPSERIFAGQLTSLSSASYKEVYCGEGVHP